MLLNNIIHPFALCWIWKNCFHVWLKITTCYVKATAIIGSRCYLVSPPPLPWTHTHAWPHLWIWVLRVCWRELCSLRLCCWRPSPRVLRLARWEDRSHSPGYWHRRIAWTIGQTRNCLGTAPSLAAPLESPEHSKCHHQHTPVKVLPTDLYVRLTVLFSHFLFTQCSTSWYTYI